MRRGWHGLLAGVLMGVAMANLPRRLDVPSAPIPRASPPASPAARHAPRVLAGLAGLGELGAGVPGEAAAATPERDLFVFLDEPKPRDATLAAAGPAPDAGAGGAPAVADPQPPGQAPALRLRGTLTAEGTTYAVMAGDARLELAAPGSIVSGRYAVRSVGASLVELEDLFTAARYRLSR